MSADTDTQATAGAGRLAKVIASRGGKAPPEAPFVIEHREALIYMLCEAAELEHGIMCQYLFAAFSLKQRKDERLTEGELAAVTRWRQAVAHVATEEMLHLALVHNLLSAIGAAPHFARPNLPAPASHYPAGVQLALVPFGEQALRHFMFLERPEGMQLKGAEGLDRAMEQARPFMAEGDIVPRGQDFATVGHLYRSIEHGFAHLAEKFGERWLFVGPPQAQATSRDWPWPELVAVTDLASAQQAIDTILEQGEGARGHWETAHFGQFVQVLDEYEQMRADNREFDPVRPVLPAKVRQGERDDGRTPLIGDPITSRCTDLFNVAYEILLQMLERYFAHTEETDEQLSTLANATISVMVRVLKPLGGVIT
ncbi:MAG TPA: ferritin-like protein, partial [Solirubrobacteraceae bacterium]|nr:ferritin-like protein [Solirubrobacteraceae bacterium]